MLDAQTLRTLAQAADFMANESYPADRGGQCSAYLVRAANKARDEAEQIERKVPGHAVRHAVIEPY